MVEIMIVCWVKPAARSWNTTDTTSSDSATYSSASNHLTFLGIAIDRAVPRLLFRLLVVSLANSFGYWRSVVGLHLRHRRMPPPSSLSISLTSFPTLATDHRHFLQCCRKTPSEPRSLSPKSSSQTQSIGLMLPLPEKLTS